MKKFKQVRNKNCDFIHEGWNHACSIFKEEPSAELNLDTFFEASFGWMNNLEYISRCHKKYPKENFISFIHNPFNTYKYQALMKVSSVKPYPECILDLLSQHCKGLFFLSKSECVKYQDFFQSQGLNIHMQSLYYPMQNFRNRFCMNKFLTNKHKLLIQSGMHLRKVSTPFLIAPSFSNTSVRLAQIPWGHRNQESLNFEIKEYNLNTKHFHLVETLPQISRENYLKLYESNLFLFDAHDTAACTLVLDCILACTPLIARRLPTNEEYLGKDYPLFFDSTAQIYDLATNFAKIQEAHEFLCNKNKTHLTLDYFKKSFESSFIFNQHD